MLNMPKRNVNASEDFFNVVVASHVFAAEMHIMGTASLSSPPETLDSECFLTVCEEVVNRYVSFRQLPGAVEDQRSDGVLAYASKTLTLGLVYLEFADAIKESDGVRLQRCWRYLLVLFRSTGRRNYAFESLNFLYQCQYSASPRVAQQLPWSRGVNTRGIPGHNIPCDLYLEHLNRMCKDWLRTLRGERKEKAVIRIGKALGTLKPILEHFDGECVITQSNSTHKPSSYMTDLNSAVVELKNVFTYICT